jgi:hypothetical protein
LESGQPYSFRAVSRVCKIYESDFWLPPLIGSRSCGTETIPELNNSGCHLIFVSVPMPDPITHERRRQNSPGTRRSVLGKLQSIPPLRNQSRADTDRTWFGIPSVYEKLIRGRIIRLQLLSSLAVTTHRTARQAWPKLFDELSIDSDDIHATHSFATGVGPVCMSGTN